jgi:predicted nucleic acid-binding protein|tara:strand:- start:392 stop:778 length:387 start_codon:yes stop_codon:yes gene_type:complete
MKYILDTSAILAYLGKEKGSAKLASFKSRSAIPFIALTELYHITWQKKGKVTADKTYGVVKAWQLPMLLPDEKIILTAGRFKVNYHLGIADSFIIYFANNRKCSLVTKDPDYEVLKDEVKNFYGFELS